MTTPVRRTPGLTSPAPRSGADPTVTRPRRVRASILLRPNDEERFHLLASRERSEHRAYAQLLKAVGGPVSAAYRAGDDEAHNVLSALLLEFTVPVALLSGPAPGAVVRGWLTNKAGRRAGLVVGQFEAEVTDEADVQHVLDAARDAGLASIAQAGRRRQAARWRSPGRSDPGSPINTAVDASTGREGVARSGQRGGERVRRIGRPLRPARYRGFVPLVEVAKRVRAKMEHDAAADIMA